MIHQHTTKLSADIKRALAAALLVAAVARSAAAQPADAQAEVLTIDAAIGLALGHNRQLASSALAVESADDAIAIARKRRLPSFNINAQLSQQLTDVSYTFPAGAFGTYPATGPIPSEGSTVTSPRSPTFYTYATVSQPVTQLFRLNLNVTASQVSRDIERERLRSAEQRVVAEVRRVYYTLLQTDAALTAARESIAVAEDLARVTRARLQQQTALRLDGIQADLSLARAVQARTALQNARASQAEQLNRLLGREINAPVAAAPIADLGPTEDDLDALIGRALEVRPDMREAKLRVEHAELDLKVKTKEQIPDVSLTLSYLTYVNMDVMPNNLAALGVQVTWEPFDWGRRKREAEIKGRTVAQARLAERETADAIAADVAATWRRVGEARAALRVAQLTEQAARERARVKSELVKVQATLQTDALDAHAQLVDATAKHQESLSSYWTARADYDRAIGENVR
jgi:outer membrane protein TolC